MPSTRICPSLAFIEAATVAVAAVAGDGELDPFEVELPHAATARTAINGMILRITESDT